MLRHCSPANLVSTLGLLTLVACDESPTPTGPQELTSTTTAAAASYSVQRLGVGLASEIAARATAINTAGDVVGYTFDPDDTYRGFIWKNGAQTHFRSSLGGRHARAYDINDVGQVVGAAENSFGRMRAFRWTNGIMRALGTLGGSESFAFATNNHGHVVGQSRIAGNTRSHAFLLKDGVMSDLGTLGGSNSAALDINDAGQVIGWSETDGGARHPFLWENGVMKDLFPAGSTSTGTAYAINPAGTVVGERDNRLFRWQNGVISGLGLANRGTHSATGIRGGRIVGGYNGEAFVLLGGDVTLLPSLPGAIYSMAWAVNSSGVIVGVSENELDGYDVVTMWTPE